MQAGDLINRIGMAYQRGRLWPAAAERIRPYAIGAKMLFAHRDESFELVIPEYSEPSAADGPLVQRIFDSLKAMKRAQRFVKEEYQPSSMWQRVLSRYPVNDLDQLHHFLTNFGTWKDDIHIESSPLLRRLNRTFLTRRYCESIVFGRQLEFWLSLNRKADLAQLSYPRHGNQAGALVDGIFVGVGSFDNQYYAHSVASLIQSNSRPQIGELGGGYGKFAYFILRESNDFCYVDFDLPEMLSIAAYYLMKCFPQKRVLLCGERDYSPHCHDEYDLIFMPPWEIEMVSNQSLDLFVNKNSLGEIRRTAALNYLSHVARSSRRFFHLNHELVPQTGDAAGLCAHEYSMPGFNLILKCRDAWNLIYQGPASDIWAYLYEMPYHGNRLSWPNNQLTTINRLPTQS